MNVRIFHFPGMNKFSKPTINGLILHSIFHIQNMVLSKTIFPEMEIFSALI